MRSSATLSTYLLPCMSTVTHPYDRFLLNVLQSFQQVLHLCLSTRFLMHIRQVTQTATRSGSDVPPISDIVFARVMPVNSLGPIDAEM